MELVSYLSLASQIKVFIHPLLPMTVQVIIVDEDCSNRVVFYLEGTGSAYPWSAVCVSSFYENNKPKGHFLKFILILDSAQL
jgi:hypothetical protein